MNNENLKYLLFSILLVVFSCDDGGVIPVYGCTDTESCNITNGANTDDGSCYYPVDACTACATSDGGNDGEDLGGQDCAGTCGGSAVNDCAGECGGTAVEDCAGDCNGSALEDNCETCDSNTENDCDADCNGDFGGTAVEDICDVCSGGNSGHDAGSDIDDCGVCFGDNASMDDCDVCDGPGPDDGFDCDGNVLYSNVQTIFNSSCTSCHGVSGGLSLESYTNLMNGGNSGDVIIAGDHASSLLWQKISGNGGGAQMPLNCSTTCLDSEIEIIANWIDQGANNP